MRGWRFEDLRSLQEDFAELEVILQPYAQALEAEIRALQAIDRMSQKIFRNWAAPLPGNYCHKEFTLIKATTKRT